MLAPFHYAFVQRGLVEMLALSLGAGVIGTWIVLRGLAFYSHAVGTATFPGLVIADGLGFSALLGAFAAANARSLGARSPLPDALLLALVGFGAVAMLSALGALLVTALLVVPAATVRLWTRTLRTWQLGSAALAVIEGVLGLWLFVEA